MQRKHFKEGLAKVLKFFQKYWYYAIICFIITIGIFYRAEIYLIDKLIGFDEAQLIYNFTENPGFLWVFHPLQNLQISPPLFLIAVKLLTKIFGYSEYVFSFIPFISSIVSIFVFYILSKQFLAKKRSIILANFLFMINFILLLYSFTFKQYGLDVTVFMIILMYSARINIEKLDWVTILKYGFIFTVLFFISQPTIFILFGFICYAFLNTSIKHSFSKRVLIDTLKNYKFIFIAFIPLVFVLLYKFSMPSNLSDFMNDYWQIGFISIKNLPLLLKENLNFFTYQAKYLFWLIPFMLIGFLISIFRKTRINQILMFSILGAVLASILHLYPLLVRVIAYFIPFMIIFISRCFDIKILNTKVDKALSFLVIFLVFIVSGLFLARVIFKNNMRIFYAANESKTINTILFENFDKKNDILILPASSKTLYHYYSKRHNFYTGNIYEVNSYNKKAFIDGLNKIEKNKTYWIYLISDDIRIRQEPFIRKWLNELKISKKAYAFKTKLGKNSILYLIRFN